MSWFRWSEKSVVKKYAYFFGEAWPEDKELLGAKAGRLAEMFQLGLPVPLGFVLSTEACHDYHDQSQRQLTSSIVRELERAVKSMETQTNSVFSYEGPTTSAKPLLLSIRVSSPLKGDVAFPTILNIGMSSSAVDTLVAHDHDELWALRAYARFLAAFGVAVLHVDQSKYTECFSEFCAENKHHRASSELKVKDLILRLRSFTIVPESPMEQLKMAVQEIYNSSCDYAGSEMGGMRGAHNVAIVIQTMVHADSFGLSGDGILNTRNPNTGVKEIDGEYVPEGDIKIHFGSIRKSLRLEHLSALSVAVFNKLLSVGGTLEQHYKDMQTVHFTLENGELFILSAKNGRRSAHAAITIANDLVTENLLTERAALLHINASQMTHFSFSTIDPHYVDSFTDQLMKLVLCRGHHGGYGCIVGQLTFDIDEAIVQSKAGVPIVLCLDHADSVIASHLAHRCIRNLGLIVLDQNLDQHVTFPSCSNTSYLTLDSKRECITTKDGKLVVKKGDVITVDGSTGLVFVGAVPMVTPMHTEEFQTVLRWADKYKRMQVFANADSAEDVEQAIELGAEGIGLCRTEHMFFKPDRLDIFRQLLLTESPRERAKILHRLALDLQNEFLNIFRALNGVQGFITIPSMSLSSIFVDWNEASFCEDSTWRALHHARTEYALEKNPSMGCVGARLAITHPAILEIHAKSIFAALISVMKIGPAPDITLMIPVALSDHEFEVCADAILGHWETAKLECDLRSCERPFKLGAVLTTPRTLFVADKIALCADMLSIDTDTLTALCFGADEEVVAQLMSTFKSEHIFSSDPFQSLDANGVSNLVRYARRKARNAKDNIAMWVSSRNGYDLHSAEFLEREGITGMSCDSHQAAKLKVMAAQAHVRHLAEVDAHLKSHPWLYYPPMI